MTGQFGTSGVKGPASAGSEPNRRLDSWKEIATFFGRDERTVKRWEKERSLPVHRLPGGSRARVFVFTEELERWMHSPESAAAQAADAESSVESGELGASAPEPAQAVFGPPASEALPPAVRRERWFWIAVAGLLIAAGGLILWRHHAGHPAAIAGPVKAATHINPEAEDFYLQGRYYWTRRTPADLTKAVDLFTQAIVRDPNYAQPYVGLADCYNLLREYAAMPSDEAFPRALAAAKKAVELDDSSAEAHASLAFVTYYWSWDAPGAEAEFRRAIALDPHYVTAHHWYATFLMSVGRYEESMNEFEAAQKLDPASAPILADKGLLLINERRFDEAETLLKQIESDQPEFFSAHQYLSYLYRARRDYPNYLNEARRAAQLKHDERQLAIVAAAEQGFRKRGERGLLENTLAMQKKFCDAQQLSPFYVAQTAALLGDKQEALHYLRLAYQQHDESFLAAARDDTLSSLRNDPEFRKLLQQAGLSTAM
ncbi:MAG TPA: tetratricopeptide repeat protein [Bryocella sp.]|nr:tetratricopeptide repeat protein [Bryocella sp.]